MSKFMTTAFVVAVSLMVSACAMHGTWGFSGELG